MNVLSPKRAFVLAAGYGTRMLPLTRDLPKPLMPLWGKPLLQYTLEMLSRWGVRDVLINLHHMPGEILEFLRQHKGLGLRIALSFEPDILGTGGALQKAGWFTGDRPFWLINSDVAADLNPQPLVKAFRRGNPIAALWLHPSRGPRTVEMREGRITTFTSRRPGAPNTFTFCGLHLVSPRILEHIPETGFAGIIDAYTRAMRCGEKVAGVCMEKSYWADLGTPANYLDAHRETRTAAVRRRPGGRLFNPLACFTAKAGRSFVAVGSDCVVERNAEATDSVLWDGARICSGARVQRAVIGRGTLVTRCVEGIACRADAGLDAREIAALNAIGMNPADATVYPLPPRGSARTFTRVVGGSRNVMLVRYSLERGENALYCRHAHFLAGVGVRVPKVLLERPRQRLAILEDLGSRSLADAMRGANDRRVFALYRRVMDQVVLLHEQGTAWARKKRIPLMPAFDKRLYEWERRYFAEEFLRQHAGLGPALRRGAVEELARIARRLLGEPLVLVHRDLQSSNILLKARGPAFIDFQGMRMGAAAYDLASLLCDPYADLPEGVQLRLLAYYNRCACVPIAEEVFYAAAIERLAQAMGAYARLGRLPGMKHFEEHIATAAGQMFRAAVVSGNLPVLERVCRYALNLCAERIDHD